MRLVADDTDVKLLGYGLGATLVFAIIIGVELFNGPPPEYSSLSPVTGEMVETYISKSRERVFADIRVKANLSDFILFQHVPERLASKIAELPSGATVSALILDKEFVDRRTSLPRHSMWQLSIDGKQVFSYDEIVQFHGNQTARWRTLAYCSAVVGVACLVAIAIRRLNRADP
jgi:hypothetical protein